MPKKHLVIGLNLHSEWKQFCLKVAGGNMNLATEKALKFYMKEYKKRMKDM